MQLVLIASTYGSTVVIGTKGSTKLSVFLLWVDLVSNIDLFSNCSELFLFFYFFVFSYVLQTVENFIITRKFMRHGGMLRHFIQIYL